ncbi:MAG TPA: Crp/Fnr family transcriptional regulator, partial [Rikenellaceae bacterium]|nr:Crp/Fnr family transcriptional regulator [Rikenellaceae bacterium]
FLIEKEAIATVMQTNAKFTTNIVKRYCLHNSNLYETIGSVLYKQMNGRMASALLYLNQLKNDHPDIFTLLTRKEVSEFAGVSTENGIKLLKTFEKDGLIKLSEKDILLLNKTMLAEIAKHG